MRRPALFVAVMLLAGCGTQTVVARYGPTECGPLVTVVVSQDRSRVDRECAEMGSLLPSLGCEQTTSVTLADGTRVRTVRVIRYAASLPSPDALEIEIHELCHVAASLQCIPDPCHLLHDYWPSAILRSSPFGARSYSGGSRTPADAP